MSAYGLRLSTYCYLNSQPDGYQYAYYDEDDAVIVWNNGGAAPTLLDLDAITTDQITAYQNRSAAVVNTSAAYTMAASQTVDISSENIVIITGNGAGILNLPVADNIGRSIEIFNG